MRGHDGMRRQTKGAVESRTGEEGKMKGGKRTAQKGAPKQRKKPTKEKWAQVRAKAREKQLRSEVTAKNRRQKKRGEKASL